jgi:hypothetical protein
MITGDNLTVGAGLSYDVASDYNTTGVSSDVHVPISKIGWGSDTITNRTTELKPIPVQMFYATGDGSTGAMVSDSGAIHVTGPVAIMGYVGITAPLGSTRGIQTRRLNAGPVGYTGFRGYTHDQSVTGSENYDTVLIQGIYNGTEIGITGSKLSIRGFYGGPIGYTGASGYGPSGAAYARPWSGVGSATADHTHGIDYIAVQGISGGHVVGITATNLNIRGLSAGVVGYTGGSFVNTDTIAIQGISGGTVVGVTFGGTALGVTGTVKIDDLTAGTDSIAVYHADGGKTLAVNITQVAGSAIGMSGDALKVYVDNHGLTLTATIGTVIYVKSPTGATSGLVVSGSTDTNAEPVHITPDGGSMTVSATDLDIRNLTATDVVAIGGQVKTDVTALKTSVAAVSTSISAQTAAINTLRTTVAGLQTLVSNLNSTVATIDGSKKMRVASSPNVPNNVKSGRTNVTPSGTQLATAGVTSLTNGIYIRANSANTSTVFIGDARVIQQPNNGYPLEAGEQLFLAVADPGNVFAISGTGNQVLHYVGS